MTRRVTRRAAGIEWVNRRCLLVKGNVHLLPIMMASTTAASTLVSMTATLAAATMM